MAQEKGILVVGGLGLAVLATYFLVRKKKVVGEIPLSTGWNEVTYTGERQIAGVATQSIQEYLVIAYYYDPFSGLWQQVVFDTILEPGMLVNIKVSQDCIWRF